VYKRINIILLIIVLFASFGAQTTKVTSESLPQVRIGIDGHLKEGVTDGLPTETAAQRFVDSKLDWIFMYWSHALLGTNRPSFASELKANGKRVILRVWWWRSSLAVTNWTHLNNDIDAYNRVLASVIAQIREAGGPDGSNIYAVQFGEAEPCEGYSWQRDIIDMDDFVEGSNRLYDDVKAEFPNLKVFVGLEAWQLGVGAETAHASDIDPIQLDSYVRAIKYRMPDYARSQFDLAVAKGIPNIAFFGKHYRPDGRQEELFFNDYEYDPSVPDYQNPYLFKQVMLDLLDEYGSPIPNRPPVLNPIGEKSAKEGQLLQFTISATDPDAGDTLTYSTSNLPPGASFDSLTQTFSWTPVYDQAGTYPDVHFEVFDGELTDSEDITNANIDTETFIPNASGSNTGCYYYDGSYNLPSAGSNYQQVDEVVADDGTAIYTNSASYIVDTFNIADHSVGSGTINHVKVYFRSEANSDSMGAKAAIYTHDTIYYGSEESLTGSWADYSHTWTTNPYTGSSWTWDEIDNLEIGVALKRGSYTAWCTQVYVEVEFTSNIFPTGDANEDGSVNSLDITKIKRIIMGLDEPTQGADANSDGNINAMDLTQIELIIISG